MHIHRDVSEIVNNAVLRDVIQIHGMEIPYPAELWANGNRQHEDGTAMFSVGDRGYLTAEYFGYDASDPLELLGMGFKQLDSKLVMKDTQVEIPIWWITSSPKARTWHSVPMSAITAYECEIHGQLGDPNGEMNSASITVTGLPDIHLGQMTSPIPEESTAVENLTLHGFKKQIGLLNIGAGEWQIRLSGSHADDKTEYLPLYHVNISRKDGSPFTLEEDIDMSVIGALKQFLSFQCGRWIDMPTIVCNPVFSRIEKHLDLRPGETSEAVLSAMCTYRASETNPWEALAELGRSLQNAHGFEDVSDAHISMVATINEQVTIHFHKGEPTRKLVWVSKMSSPNISVGNTWTATEARLWDALFNEFWKQYTEPYGHERLKNAVFHYVEAQRVLENSSIGQALVAAQSTLQALTRWWNDLDMNFQFGSGPKNRYNDLIVNAVRRAGLGYDNGVAIDEEALRNAINIATDYRNDIDHGNGINIDTHEQSVVYCQMHHHNLARLLILAKLGNRGRDARGCFAGPKFTAAQN